ncbi:MAG: SWIM zinc finger family protein [Verrucomicrobiota bacterium]
MIVAFDYASPSVLDSSRDHALLGISANARRPVRFHGRVTRNVPLLRFTLRALGEAIWSNDIWESQGDLMSWILDPVITVHPDRIFFETFSQDQSVYAMVIANPDMFAAEGEIVTGTTNVDFTAWLWGALNELRSSRETWLRVGAEGFEVKTKGAGGRFEQKVELPDNWVRGFLQVTGAMAMPGTRLTVRPADLLAAIRYLRYTKAKVSPRALRYEFTPGKEARIVLEPWEETIRLRGAEHNYTEPKVIRTWGRRRLNLIEPLLPFATSVDIYLKGRGLPSFYVVKMPDLTFVLGLSGWSSQSWTEAGSFDLLSDTTAAQDELIAPVQQLLRNAFHATPKQIAATLNQPPDAVWRACERLCRQGRAIFDVETRGFRYRELFEEPIDEAKFFPPDERLHKANVLIAKHAVPFVRCEPSENRKVRRTRNPTTGEMMEREVIYRDWRVSGSVESDKTEIVVGDPERIIFGTCSCAFFQEHLLSKGPCEHMIALFKASADGRKDLPTSTAATSGGIASPRKAREDEEESKDEDSEEDFDENESDENNEGR